MKRSFSLLALLAALLLLSACGSDKAPVSGKTDSGEVMVQKEAAAGSDTKDTAKEEDADTSSLQNQSPDSLKGKKLHIYYSNEMADGLEMTSVDADEITPELILSNLSKYNIVTQDTRIRSMEISQEGDDTVLLLDLSREFGNYVSSMGTSGEYVIIAALTDTFLDAYQAQRLRLLVEGGRLETGHALYDWDLTWYQLTSYSVETRTYEQKNIHLEYPQLINVKDSFTETEWNEILESCAMEDVKYLDPEAEYDLTYEVATATEELLSIVYRVSGYEPGAAHPYFYIQTFNIDLNSGREVRLTDFVNTEKLVERLVSGKGYELVNTQLDNKSFQEYLSTSPDMLTKEYFEKFDLDFMNPDAHPMGYSYKKDGSIIVCMEVPHTLGDFVEIKIR